MSLPGCSMWLSPAQLIPSCILKSNSHIGEVGQRTDAVGIGSELGEACAERVLQSIKGRERLVGQGLLPQFFPDMLGWIEFRTAGRLGQQPDVLRNRQPLGRMPARAVHEH